MTDKLSSQHRSSESKTIIRNFVESIQLGGCFIKEKILYVDMDNVHIVFNDPLSSFHLITHILPLYKKK